MFFSIIIPAYNVEKYINECINSVLSQTYTDYELIIVNDGSTDSTGELCEIIARGNSAIKIINQTNKGLSGARNTGIREAKGEYLIFLDGDDF